MDIKITTMPILKVVRIPSLLAALMQSAVTINLNYPRTCMGDPSQ